VLRAAYAEPLDDAMQAIFHEIAGGRKPPEHPIKRLVVFAGRRSAKTRIASLIGLCHTACSDYHDVLGAGERATSLLLAVDRAQARNAFRYTEGLVRRIPKEELMRETLSSFDFANATSIEIATASFRSTRGYSISCGIFDEFAFHRDDTVANPSKETWNG